MGDKNERIRNLVHKMNNTIKGLELELQEKNNDVEKYINENRELLKRNSSLNTALKEGTKSFGISNQTIKNQLSRKSEELTKIKDESLKKDRKINNISNQLRVKKAEVEEKDEMIDKFENNIQEFLKMQNENRRKYQSLQSKVDHLSNAKKSTEEIAKIKPTPNLVPVHNIYDGKYRPGESEIDKMSDDEIVKGELEQLKKEDPIANLEGNVKARTTAIENQIERTKLKPMQRGFVRGQVRRLVEGRPMERVNGGKRKSKRRNKKNIRRTIKNKNR